MNLLEIERKFLVIGEFRSLAKGCTHIAQGYIASGNGRTVRVRIRGDKGYLTIKGPSNKAGLARFEWEKEIPLAEAGGRCLLGRQRRADNGRDRVEERGRYIQKAPFHRQRGYRRPPFLQQPHAPLPL